jgi:hypothetical protein
MVARVVPVDGIGGMQDHTADLARGLIAASHDVAVIYGQASLGAS